VHAKGVGAEKSENGIGSSMLNINFMSVTQHCITASVFVIFLWHSALVVIVTIIDCGNGAKSYNCPHPVSKVTSNQMNDVAVFWNLVLFSS
jgi:hypothetical protein